MTAVIFLLVCNLAARLFAVPPARDDGFSSASKQLGLLHDDDDDRIDGPEVPGASAAPLPQGRYCLDLLDHRSRYGEDFFPDPFLGPEFDRETQLEVDYLHGARNGAREDEGDAGFQWNLIGQLTLAGEFGYDSERQPKAPGGETDRVDDQKENGRGFENVDLALYHPVFQAVSKGGTLDYTAAMRLDVGIPTHTAVSGTDFQLTPYLGQLLRVGGHVSVEAWTGSQFTLASHQADPFIYGASFGYRIPRDQVALPFTRTVTPLFELDGQLPLANHGRDVLFGVAGFNWQFMGRGDWQPRLGFGYQFPIDGGARERLHWGIVTQIFLDF